MIWIGIDPGKNGGIAAIGPGPSDAAAWKMPSTERDTLAVLKDAVMGLGSFALIERAQAFPGMGVSGAFNYGGNYFGLRMALVALEIPFEVVAPGVWQRTMRCLTKGDKNVTKRRAQELFPTLKITHAIADALLIAEYNKRSRT
jgi:hypothetical protein